MANQKQVHVTVVTLFLISLHTITAYSAQNDLEGIRGDPRLLQLRYLGIVDGKSYFTEPDTEFTWEEAREYCGSFDLKLATIQTKEVSNYLVEALKADGDAFYWTSARDSRRPSMLVWDDTNVPLDTSIHSEWVDATIDLPYYHCGAFGMVDDKSYMALVPCVEKKYLLCQG